MLTKGRSSKELKLGIGKESGIGIEIGAGIGIGIGTAERILGPETDRIEKTPLGEELATGAEIGIGIGIGIEKDGLGFDYYWRAWT